MSTDTDAVIPQVRQAVSDGRLSDSAAKNIRTWLTEPRYADYAPQVIEHIQQQKWKELDDVFWTIIPFGTGGRRGKMYPIGSNAINDRTIGESAQGLADCVKEHWEKSSRLEAHAPELACAIAYDTRHRSRHFAELCAEVMVAAGFGVWFLDGYRSTPELSFLVRYKRCACGIMVTASHNPPSDNAVKAYWSTGGQLLPPYDEGVIEQVMSTDEIRRAPFADAVKSRQVVFCQEEVDAAYIREVKNLSLPGPRELKILYSPLHGVGASSVVPVLRADGFNQVDVFGPNAEPSGDFPNVPGHVSNPENPAVFDAIIAQAKTDGCDLVMATDPDCDRLGCAAPRTKDRTGEWGTFTGNQIGALLADWVLSQRQSAGSLSPEHYVVKTLVTTEMIRRIADAYGVQTYGNLHVGFKWIGGLMDEMGPDKFVLGMEESHGYLAGQYARDKDGALAAMLLAELAASLKAAGQSLHEKLEALFWQFGYHAERTVSQTMPGSEGMQRMKAVMAGFRNDPPASLGTLQVKRIRDYLSGTLTEGAGKPVPLEAPRGDMVILDLSEEGNYVAVRPSGTEPKAKFYMFTYVAAEQLANLDDARDEMQQRLDAIAADLKQFAEERE